MRFTTTAAFLVSLIGIAHALSLPQIHCSPDDYDCCAVPGPKCDVSPSHSSLRGSEITDTLHLVTAQCHQVDAI
jgi:hypothetical protein